jgi:transcriptional regulator with XRE-family HTH domain
MSYRDGSRGRSVEDGAHRLLPKQLAHAPPYQFTARSRHDIVKPEERTGADRSAQAAGRFAGMRVLADVTGENLRRWRESKGWDVPRMARELRKVARDTGEDVAAHHGLVKMIPQWERGGRAPRERYRLLYLKVFEDMAVGLSQDMASGADLVMRFAEIRSHAAGLPAPDEIRTLEAAALAKPRKTMTSAEIRARAAEAIIHLREVAAKIAELSALLGDEAVGEAES